MFKNSILFLITILLLTACKNNSSFNNYAPKKYVEINHPTWTKNATIYQANIRQYTKEGTFKAFEAHLPKIKNMGIDIIWLMPIHPIGEKNRKGGLGSGYSVKDYYGINPEFGNLQDFKNLVAKIHAMDMHIIIDWVGNHSAWDNPLAAQHPDWYTKNAEGNFQPTPWYDWDDVIDFDYNQPEMRKYMTNAMKYWVQDIGIDGYRCDVAGFIPVEFWENVRKELDAIKPVFMLAEWETRDLHKKSFDATYAWTLWTHLKNATTGDGKLNGLVEYMAHDVGHFPRDAYRMTFTENHDKNSWEGTQYKNFGDGLKAAMVMTCTVNGMPLVYGGQEAGLNKSLLFFEKDSIDWSKDVFSDMYKKLFNLKHQNQALWNGEQGGEMVRIYSDNMDHVISFSRTKNNNKVIPIINFSNKAVSVKLNSKNEKGDYTELFTNEKISLKGDDVFTLQAWDYKVLVK